MTSRIAPPWHLRGRGTVLLYRFPAGFPCRLGLILLVDYEASEVGPYRELAFVAGRFVLEGERFFTIPRIWVSTEASRVNGRENWGLPKELAEFRIEREGRRERAVVTAGGRTVADLEVEGWGAALPALPAVRVTAGLLPRSWRTLLQLWEGRSYKVVLEGAGRVRPVRVRLARTDPELLHGPSHGRLLGAVRIESFRLEVPAPEIE